MPILTDTRSTSAYLSGAGGSGSAILFPKDSIIPYYSTSAVPTLTDWGLYNVGASKYICGTTNSELVGTTTTSTIASAYFSLGTTGSHTGTISYVSCGGYTTGSNINDSSNLSAGAHAHTGTITFNSSLFPNRYNVNLLIATKDTIGIPGNTIGFRASGSYGTALSDIGYLHVSEAAGTYNTGSLNSIGYSATTQGGAHLHHNNVMQYYITGSTNNYFGVASGGHSHNLSANFTQTVMGTTIGLSSWFSATARPVMSDVIVMYAGSPAGLPSGWYICNGSNGTLNISGMYVQVSTSASGTLSYSDGAISNAQVGTIGSHSHVGTTNPAGAGITLWHGSQSWPHTHTPSISKSDYELGKLYLYFIQYKG